MGSLPCRVGDKRAGASEVVSIDCRLAKKAHTPQLRLLTAGLDPAASLASLQASVAEKSGVAVARQELLSGFPPKPLQVC